MKTATVVCLALFVSAVAMFLLQLWLQCWSPEMFSKLFVTDVVLFAASYVIAFVIKEGKDTAKINKKNELD